MIESDVRDELSTLVADAPGGVNKMMKTILALSRIKGGVGLRGCDSANMLAERLNELRTQIDDYSLKPSLRGAVSPDDENGCGEWTVPFELRPRGLASWRGRLRRRRRRHRRSLRRRRRRLRHEGRERRGRGLGRGRHDVLDPEEMREVGE